MKSLIVPADLLHEGNRIWAVDLVYCVDDYTSNSVCKDLIITNNVRVDDQPINNINEFIDLEDGMELEIFNQKYTIKLEDSNQHAEDLYDLTM